MAKETRWAPVLGYEGRYEVSDHGEVRNAKSCRLLRSWPNHKGYLYVGLSAPIKRGVYRTKTFRVHRLVLEAFVGRRPEGLQCGHLDGDQQNNHLANLRWITPKENAAHREVHGTNLKGERNPWAKLTEDSVQRIRRMQGGILRWEDIAKRMGVSTGAVKNVLLRRTWAWLPEPEDDSPRWCAFCCMPVEGDGDRSCQPAFKCADCGAVMVVSRPPLPAKAAESQGDGA